ncbi:protein lutein deficient 5, chloroplastic [Tanacetum coccineum]
MSSISQPFKILDAQAECSQPLIGFCVGLDCQHGNPMWGVGLWIWRGLDCYGKSNEGDRWRVKRKGFDGDLKMNMVVLVLGLSNQEEKRETDSTVDNEVIRILLNHLSYLPFSGGPRKCVGDMFASFEAIVAVAMLVHRFNFQMALGAPSQPWRSVPFELKERQAPNERNTTHIESQFQPSNENKISQRKHPLMSIDVCNSSGTTTETATVFPSLTDSMPGSPYNDKINIHEYLYYGALDGKETEMDITPSNESKKLILIKYEESHNVSGVAYETVVNKGYPKLMRSYGCGANTSFGSSSRNSLEGNWGSISGYVSTISDAPRATSDAPRATSDTLLACQIVPPSLLGLIGSSDPLICRQTAFFSPLTNTFTAAIAFMHNDEETLQALNQSFIQQSSRSLDVDGVSFQNNVMSNLTLLSFLL